MDAADQIETELTESPQPATLRCARGGPPGNSKAVKHGVYSLTAARKRCRIYKRTSFGKAFEARKAEYVTHLGGDNSLLWN
jgi:hypothetical protein